MPSDPALPPHVFDRSGRPVATAQADLLLQDTAYALVAATAVGPTVVRTVWHGTPQRTTPAGERPLIFSTVTEDQDGHRLTGPILAASEVEARAVHEHHVKTARRRHR